MRVERFSIDDPTEWFQRGDQQIFLGDVVDHTTNAAMSVGFARYRKGETNDWIVNYDEALIVTKGAFTVRTSDGTSSARAGEVIYLRTGAEVIYQADEDTELVYVSYPHWFVATQNSAQAEKLNEFQLATPGPTG